jgi:hypothetical protein
LDVAALTVKVRRAALGAGLDAVGVASAEPFAPPRRVRPCGSDPGPDVRAEVAAAGTVVARLRRRSGTCEADAPPVGSPHPETQPGDRAAAPLNPPPDPPGARPPGPVA